MSKYNRHQSVISRQSDESMEEDYWLKKFHDSLKKDAVQPVKQDSLFDQINNIMNGSSHSKHKSVDAAVEDMKERSGLTAYLKKVNSDTDNNTQSKVSTASDEQNVIDKEIDITPIVIKKHPAIKQTLENYIKDTRGNLSVPAIISKIQSVHQGDCSDAKDWDDEKLIKLVSKLNLSEKASNPDSFTNYSNLGKRDVLSDTDVDPSNTDAFSALNPVKL